MGWRKKEKPLPIDQALDLARTQAKPNWYNFEPQFVCSEVQSKLVALPLEESFGKTPWFLYFLDPFTFSGQAAFKLCQRWIDRFRFHPPRTLFVLESRYPSFFKEESKQTLKQLLVKKRVQDPLVVDPGEIIAKTFGLKQVCPNSPANLVGGIIYGAQGSVVRAGISWHKDFESLIQEFLWRGDPGISFYPVYIPEEGEIFEDTSRIEFGTQSSQHRAKEDLKIEIKGQWNRDEERITTSDPTAWIRFKCPDRMLSAVLEGHNPEMISKVLVELDGIPPYDKLHGEDVMADDEGRVTVKPQLLDWFELLSGLPPGPREVTLKFPFADKCPISVYSVCFGK